MAITIEEVESPHECATSFEVVVHNRTVCALVTRCPSAVDLWISVHLLSARDYPRTVGFDIKWRPSFARGVRHPVATIHLCIGRCCLVYQILRARCLPRSLYLALRDPRFVFTGVRIAPDAAKLSEDYGLEVKKAVDLGKLAARETNRRELRRAGLATLVRELKGRDLKIPREIALGKWDARRLTPRQVKYACADAYYSFQLGHLLLFDEIFMMWVMKWFGSLQRPSDEGQYLDDMLEDLR
ncbi:Werner Syndrome-like exonuclease [Rhodamnia argentea]|uniref:Werner Syndrome-like exonuclease n=1 Tax=Rhodamnia argentea TaxID=178133 RepID=A0A8B8NFB3_9MYRT|nr:Werner Syndrome-like exonuclease [Rhodamnia argentea]